MKQYESDHIVRTPLGEYYVAELRGLASEWHGGQWSALYAFASTGTVVDGLAFEAGQCAQTVDSSETPEAYACDEADKLRAIASLEVEG